MKAIWSGSISFSLINIPVKIYVATESHGIKFKNLCKEGHPIEHKRWCPVCNREVAWDEIKKGYKITKDKYVVLEKEDLEKIKLKTTKAIEIKQFVDATQIDPIYYEKSYYVVPQETGAKAYSLFVDALRLTNKVAIGKVVMRNKEYLVALRPYKKGLLMHILHYLSEVKPIEELPELKNLVVVSEEELKLAQMLIQKLSGEFDISKFKDHYTEKLKELIKAKLEGREIAVKEEEKEELAKSLVEALKSSLEMVEKKEKEEKKKEEVKEKAK